MLFFLNLKRLKARRLKITELDKEISRLYEKKSELELKIQKSDLEFEIEIQKREASIRALDINKKELTDLITLNEQIDKATYTLASLNTEIENAREKYKTILQESLDNNLKKLLNTFPSIKPAELNILTCFNGFKNNVIYFNDIEVAINTNLKKFAIAHKIDPILYKDLMYHFNEPWIKRLNELKKKYESLNVKNYENDRLFNGFVVLVDDEN